MEQKTAVVVGYGHRGAAYAEYCAAHPERMKLVGAVDPSPSRLAAAKAKFALPDEMCFSDFDAFVRRGKIADCAINCTMDPLHVPTTLPLLGMGYDVLLEKPIAPDAEGLLALARTAARTGSRLMICHVLRYAAFYRKVKDLMLEGAVGSVRHIETSEGECFAHAAASYVRGKWNSKKRSGSSYLLAKSCHDVDLLCWLMEDAYPVAASSVGSRSYFIPENAPTGSGKRCLVDCAIEKECPFSVRKFADKSSRFSPYVWEEYRDREMTEEEKLRALKFDSPHGACVWKTDSDLVDQQIVSLRFSNGRTAVHSLISGVPKHCRRIHVWGDKGELIGCFEDGDLRLIRVDPVTLEEREEKVAIDRSAGCECGHDGGDLLLMDDFYARLAGSARSVSCTDIADSLNGHLAVYAADRSMESGVTVPVERPE